MDPISTAILAAIAAGAVAGATKVGEQAIVDAYTGLKELLKRKFGAKSEVVKAVKALEAKPDSAARKGVVNEEVAAAKADQDPELLQAAQALLDRIGAKPGGMQVIQQATGSYIAQASGGSSASVNVNTPKS